MKRTYQILLYFVLPVLLALLIIVLIALPYGLKSYINKHGVDYTGRGISVQDIKINYFKTSFSVIGFKMLEADGKSTFVSFDTLQLRISPFPLLASKLVARELRLTGPFVNLERKDSVFNYDSILAFLAAKNKAEAPAKADSSTFEYTLNNISLDRGRFTFTDKTVNYTTTLKDLHFFIPSVSFNKDEIKETGIEFRFENGGSCQAKSSFNRASGAYAADFKVDKLDLAPFLPYLKSYLKLKSMEGLVKGEFHVGGRTSNLDSILIRGKGMVADFLVRDLAGQKVLGVRQAAVEMNDTYPLKYNFQFGSISLTEPYLYAEVKDSTLNLLKLMVETPADTVPVTYIYHINRFRIDQGLMDIRDITYEEPFDYHLSEIAMKVDSVSSTAKWINAFSTMKLNKRGKLQAELGFDPSNPYELKTDYVITNFQLTDLNIYSKHFVGFPILEGNMYYKGKTAIRSKQLTSENKLIIRNARLGKKSGGLMNLPLKLALYLLKDIHGDITLDLPLTGDLNNPKTKIGRLVWQTLKNVVVKVVASPFIALSGLMGVDPAEVKGLEFDYADTTLTSTHLRRIKLYTELEKKKPDMTMALNYFNDAALEGKELARREAGKQFLAATGLDYQKDGAKFKAFLAEKLKSDTVSADYGSIRLVGEHRLDSIQQSYARVRIQKIEAALRSFDDSTRIRVTIPDRASPENVGSRPVFELKCSVEE